ncbi:MAG TPA: hypothetical protein VGJ60_07585 [Chloroflexota bacterium]|jgi:hypothetical protein
MSRLVTCGWESGDSSELGFDYTNIGSVTAVNTSPTPRTAYCIKAWTPSASFDSSYKTIVFGPAANEVWVRWSGNFQLYNGGASGDSIAPFCELRDPNGVALASLCLRSTQFIDACQGSNGTVVATSSVSVSLAVWHTLEWRHQMSSTTSGITEVWLDGMQIILFSGDNNAATTLLTIGQLRIGCIGVVRGASYHCFDDLAINDTTGTINNGRPGDGRVVFLPPSGTGSSTMLTRGGTDSGANWSQVDESPMSVADYVQSATPGDRDLYAITDLAAPPVVIYAVDVVAQAQKGDAGEAAAAATLKSGAAVLEGSAVTLGMWPAYPRLARETDPNTGQPWTFAGVNGAEAGVTVR